jgi:hypothetical protein
MSGTDEQSRKRYGSFWGNQTFAVMNFNDGLWVDGGHKTEPN